MGVFNYGWAPQKFGASRDGGRRSHAGIDLGTAGRKGVAMGAPFDGWKVSYAGLKGGYGYTVDLVSPDGTKMMRFAHLEPLPKHIKPGVVLKQGEWLGNVGGTGRGGRRRYAIHLHFELRVKGKNGRFVPVNPFGNNYHTFNKEQFEQISKAATASRAGRQYALNIPKPRSGSYVFKQQPPAGKLSYDKKLERRSAFQGRGPLRPEFLHSNQSPNGPFLTSESVSQLEAMNQSRDASLFSLERTFGDPSWWAQNMPTWLGGWSKEELAIAERQKYLDHKIFQGVTRSDLLRAGLSEEDVRLLDQHIRQKQDENKRVMEEQGVQKTLQQSAIQIDPREVLDQEKSRIVYQTFVRNNRNA